MTIPKLPEMAAEQVDLASVPFSTFIANKKKSGDHASYSFVLRGYVRHWLDTVWAEYDRVDLAAIVQARESPAPPCWQVATRHEGCRSDVSGAAGIRLQARGLPVGSCARSKWRGRM